MSRIRTIKPEFFKHHDLYQAEVETRLPLRLAYAGIWTVCDREGRFKWKPAEMKLDVLPHDKVNFSRVLDELATRGFIVKYTSGGKDYGYIPSWNQHQVINNREKASLLPVPTEPEELTREGRDTEKEKTPLSSDTGEGKGREQGTGKEPEGEQERKTPLPPVGDEALKLRFDQIRKGYTGNTVGLSIQWESFLKKNIVTAQLLESMEKALVKEEKHKQWLRSTGKHCPPWAHFSTWVNQKRWEQKLDTEFENLYAENQEFEITSTFTLGSTLVADCFELYRKFYLEILKQPEPKIDILDHPKMASILGYLAIIVPKDKRIEDALSYIFLHWKNLPKYMQGFIRLDQIDKNLPNILYALKNGNSKTELQDYASDVMQGRR